MIDKFVEAQREILIVATFTWAWPPPPQVIATIVRSLVSTANSRYGAPGPLARWCGFQLPGQSPVSPAATSVLAPVHLALGRPRKGGDEMSGRGNHLVEHPQDFAERSGVVCDGLVADPPQAPSGAAPGAGVLELSK